MGTIHALTTLQLSPISSKSRKRSLERCTLTNPLDNHNPNHKLSVKPLKTNTRAHRLPLSPPSLLPPPSSPAAAFCNALDNFINTYVDPPGLRPHVDPRRVLTGNFSPVPELPPTPCPVVRGSIPPCLRGGAYLRNGPNPQHLPHGPHHLFDGDGMLHALLLSPDDGAAPATLSSRFVRTYKYTAEHRAGGPLLPSPISGFHGMAGIARSLVGVIRVLTGQLNPMEGVGLANTSLVFFYDRLYALADPDLPYAIHLDHETGDVSTIGRHDFDGKLSMMMTPHPKKDPRTGEMFAFRCGLLRPYINYFRFDPAGNKMAPDIPIFSIKQPSFIHDFAITKNFAIFAENQLTIKPLNMVTGPGLPVVVDRRKVTRIGILPRYARSESEMQWFEVSGFNAMHTINAWEEDDSDVVVLVATNTLCIEHLLERMDLVHMVVEMVRIDRRSGTVTRKPMSASNLDMGVINQRYVGIKNRYAYLGVWDAIPKIRGVVKLDFERAGSGDCVVARREFGPGCFGGEPMFVPAAGDEEGEEEEEDEGYLVSYVHDERSGESRFVVMDAQSPELEVVAEVSLPTRVPYGFHGLFVTAAELQSQKSMVSSDVY